MVVYAATVYKYGLKIQNCLLVIILVSMNERLQKSIYL